MRAGRGADRREQVLAAPRRCLKPFSSATACGANGTLCGRFIFIRGPGISQTPLLKIEFGPFSLPKLSGANKRQRQQLKAVECFRRTIVSIDSPQEPTKATGSTMAALGVTIGVISAPLSADVGSVSERPVATASLKTSPMVDLSLLAVSWLPLPSTSFRTARIRRP